MWLSSLFLYLCRVSVRMWWYGSNSDLCHFFAVGVGLPYLIFAVFFSTSLSVSRTPASKWPHFLFFATLNVVFTPENLPALKFYIKLSRLKEA